jgi:hypothetical protein
MSVGHLCPSSSGATVTKCGANNAPADHVTVTWLAKICNGIKRCRKVHSSFTQTVGKITVGINKQKIIKYSSLKYIGVTNTLLTFKKTMSGRREKHSNCDVHNPNFARFPLITKIVSAAKKKQQK